MSILTRASVLNLALRKTGWEVRRSATWSRLLGHLPVATVVDVGAADGTPELYAAFPNAYLTLIEPLVEYQAALGKWVEGGRGEIWSVGVGAKAGLLELHVDPGRPTRSSFNDRTAQTARETTLRSRTVAITTIDELWHQATWRSPLLLKIDTEGFELEVIQGAATVLSEAIAVIAEVSVGRRFANGYRFEELVEAMATHGFTLTNILTLPRRPDGNVPWIDALFERSDRTGSV